MKVLPSSKSTPEENKHSCFSSAMVPGGDGPIPQQPVDELLSHNAVWVSSEPVSVVLKLHTCAVMANFLPQVLQLRGILQDIQYWLGSFRLGSIKEKPSGDHGG